VLEGEEEWSALGDDEGVFVVCGERLIGSADGPPVRVEGDLAGARGDDGLDGEDEPLGEKCAIEGVGIIGDGRVFVNRVANTVAAQFANDMEAASTHLAFNGAANFADGVAGACGGERLAEGALGAAGEIASSCGCWCDLDGDRGIGVIAVFFCREVEFDEIARSEDAATRNAVNNFVVDADADLAGESVNHGWG